jgi:hypothetical protein
MNLLSYENTSNSLKSLNEEIFVPDVSTVVHNLLKYSKFGGNEQGRLCQIHGMLNVLVYLRSDNKFVLASNYLRLLFLVTYTTELKPGIFGLDSA